MSNAMSKLLLLISMIGLIVISDILYFRNHFGARLAFNVGIVLIFAALYFRFLNNLGVC